MSRTDVIVHLVRARGYDRYLEIGVEHPENNFDRIPVTTKVGVEAFPRKSGFRDRPIHECTSKEFFETRNKEAFDIIFIDGDHSYEGSSYDFVEACKILKDGGTIVMHDCLPRHRQLIGDKPVDAEAPWCGGVWRVWMNICQSAMRTEVMLVNTDFGCGVYSPSSDPIHYTDFSPSLEEKALGHLAVVTPLVFMTKLEYERAARAMRLDEPVLLG